jgi:alanine dehydrogenase
MDRASNDIELLLLSARDVRAVLTPDRAFAALARAYRLAAGAPSARALGFEIAGGSLHIKAGGLPGTPRAFAAKINVNLPGNPARGMPTIQGVVLLVDTTTGRPLAAMDSRAITGIRTAAAAALAASHAAARHPRIAAIIGCGEQAGYVAAALRARFALDEIRAFDIDASRARDFARRLTRDGAKCVAAADIRAAVEGADICVTCTTATAPVLTGDLDLRFVAALGADNPKKREIDDAAMRRARVVADDPDACRAGGELSHRRGGPAPVALARLVAGGRFARATLRRPVIYDSTGSGMQDAAAAWSAFVHATKAGIGRRFDLGG